MKKIREWFGKSKKRAASVIILSAALLFAFIYGGVSYSHADMKADSTKVTAVQETEKPKSSASPSAGAETEDKQDSEKKSAGETEKPAETETPQAAAPGSGTGTGQAASHAAKPQACSQKWVVDSEAWDEQVQVQTGTTTVIDQPAWDEQVVSVPEHDEQQYTRYYYCTWDQTKFPYTPEGAQQFAKHFCLSGSTSTHYEYTTVHVPAQYSTVHHDAVTHEEPVYQTQTVHHDAAGHYEQSCQ